MNELVSIIIPVYNTGTYLENCLNSVKNQTYFNIEVIMIDDGSIDDSGKICDDFAKADNRFNVIHTSNKGVSSARNTGLSVANGELISFVDSDDYIEPNMIEELLIDFDDQEDIIISALNVYEEMPMFTCGFEKNDSEKLAFLLKNYLIFGPTQKLYRKHIIDTNIILFPECIDYGEDLLFNLKYLSFCKRIKYSPISYYHYNRRQNSLSLKIRWNRYENDMNLNYALIDFFSERLLFEGEIKKIILARILDNIVNSVFLFANSKCQLSFQETYVQIKKILNNEFCRQCIIECDVSLYPTWQIRLIEKKQTILLALICFWARRNNE